MVWIWNNGPSFVQSSDTFQRWNPLVVQGSGQYHAKGSQGSTKWNQSRTQPRRHKEGGGSSVCTPWIFAGPKDNVDGRWMREDHVL